MQFPRTDHIVRHMKPSLFLLGYFLFSFVPTSEAWDPLVRIEPTFRQVFETMEVRDLTLQNVSAPEAFERFTTLMHEHRGVDGEAFSIVLLIKPGEIKSPNVTLNMERGTVKQAVEAICHQAKLKYHLDDYAIIIGRSPLEQVRRPFPDERDSQPASITFPEARFTNANADTVIAAIEEMSKPIDMNKVGVKIHPPRDGSGGAAKVNFWCFRVPVYKLMEYICLTEGWGYRLHGNVFSLYRLEGNRAKP